MKVRTTALLIAALVCAMALLPMGALAVSNVSQLNADPSTGQIYFGNNVKTSPAPALYRYVANDATQTAAATTITLFYHGNSIAEGGMNYDTSRDHRLWSGSSICLWLNGSSFLNNAGVFTTAEKAALKTQYSAVEENGYNSTDTFMPNQTIVLPSVTEVKDDGAWGMNKEARKTQSVDFWWWLRSPGIYSYYAAIVDPDGGVNPHGNSVSESEGVRPAFKLKLSSILFTSAAAGGKSGAANAALSSVSDPIGEQKLTIFSDSLSAGDVTVHGDNTNAGTTVKVSATGATAGKSLSAVIVDGRGAITHYGKIADISPTGTVTDASLTLPVPLSANAVLKIFAEEINGDNVTDYASAFAKEKAAASTAPMAAPPITGDDSPIALWLALLALAGAGLAALGRKHAKA